jgi:hypothetical protein
MTKNATAILSELNVKHIVVEHAGATYCVTTDTGEVNFGSERGGWAAFAYDSSDDTDEEIDNYNDFCQCFYAVADRGLAIEVAKRGYRLTEAGSCTPVLTDAEFLLVRAGQDIDMSPSEIRYEIELQLSPAALEWFSNTTNANEFLITAQRVSVDAAVAEIEACAARPAAYRWDGSALYRYSDESDAYIHCFQSMHIKDMNEAIRLYEARKAAAAD